MWPRPPDQCLGKNRHSINIDKHINKLLILVHVMLSSQSLRLQLQGHHSCLLLHTPSHVGIPSIHPHCQRPSSTLTSTPATTQTGLFIPASHLLEHVLHPTRELFLKHVENLLENWVPQSGPLLVISLFYIFTLFYRWEISLTCVIWFDPHGLLRQKFFSSLYSQRNRDSKTRS